MLEAGVTKFRWHDLRHTFASRLIVADVNILTVQKLMRHETLTMTLRYGASSPVTSSRSSRKTRCSEVYKECTDTQRENSRAVSNHSLSY